MDIIALAKMSKKKAHVVTQVIINVLVLTILRIFLNVKGSTVYTERKYKD